MRSFLQTICIGFLLGTAGALAAEPVPKLDDRSLVLGLVSLEYHLAGKAHPRTHEFAPYVPLFDSSVAGVSELAKCSVLWERFALSAGQADQKFIDDVEDFVGADANGRFKPGALMKFLDDEPLAKSFGGLLDSQNNRYAFLLALAQMQDTLWDRAESLARAGAEAGELDPKRLEITFGPKKGLGWAITVRNRSAEALPHLTLAATTKVRPLPPANPGADFLLGGLAAALTGEEDAQQLAKSGATLANSVENHRKLQERPFRIFAHVPSLPPGEAWEVMLLRDTFELARCDSAMFSLWGDKLTVEGKPVPGFEARATGTRKKMEADAKKAAKARVMPGTFKKPPKKRPTTKRPAQR